VPLPASVSTLSDCVHAAAEPAAEPAAERAAAEPTAERIAETRAEMRSRLRAKVARSTRKGNSGTKLGRTRCTQVDNDVCVVSFLTNV
jgi:hypothetical protein